jgi:hypothetical protein
MSEPTVRADAVDVEQIMRQIRARIREKRGADYTETELQQLASVKLEKFMDPQGLRSDLIEQFRKRQAAPGTAAQADAGAVPEPPLGLYRRLRRFVGSTLRLLSNPYRILALDARMQSLEIRLQERDSLYYELMHNLTLEITRLGIEVHNITMRVESLSSRLDFDERRGRSLESVVQYRPQTAARPQPASAAPVTDVSAAAPDGRPRQGGQPGRPGQPGVPGESTGEPGGERRRRRRRRRRRPGQTFAEGGGRPQDATAGAASDSRAGTHDSSGEGPDFADGPADDDGGDESTDTTES